MRHFNMRLSQNELYKQIDICTSITSLLIFFAREYTDIYTMSYKSVLSTIFKGKFSNFLLPGNLQTSEMIRKYIQKTRKIFTT